MAAVSTDVLGYADCPWFLAHERKEAPDKYLSGLVDEMRNRQANLFDNTKKCMAIFQWGGDAREVEDDEDPELEQTCNSYNAAKNVVETTHAKICKSRILPMPLTSGGGYLARNEAKQLGKALEGEFDENDVDQIKEDVVMDALVTAHGAGAAKVFAKGGRPCIEHVPIEDVWFDAAETRQRKPRCCYHVQNVDIFVALAEYGKDDPDLYGSPAERREGIRRAGSKGNIRRINARGGPCRIEIIEAWHKPSSDCTEDEAEEANESDAEEQGEEAAEAQASDGRHTIIVDGCTLLDEAWDGADFPIEFYVPRKRRRSIWGMSMMFDLVAPQREYEKVTAKIQNQHQKMGVSQWLAPLGAKLNVRELVAGTFAAGAVAEFDGQTPPVPVVVDPVAPGTYQYAASIPVNMMQSQGVSQLSAQSQLPAGLQQASGKALQVFEDFESERLLCYHRELERFIVRLSWRIVDVAYDLVARGKNARVRFRGKLGIEKLRWADVLPKNREDLVLRVFPVSQLSKQPSARFAQLQELLNAGAITIEQFKRLYEMPDIEAENQLDTADTDIIDRNMDIMITTGRYQSPEPFDDLDLLIKRAGKMINLCRSQEVPDARIKLLHDWIEDAKGLQEQIAAEARQKAAEAAAAAAPPLPMGMPPMPPGPPGMPPPGAPPMPVAA